jgi:hypothetical protein
MDMRGTVAETGNRDDTSPQKPRRSVLSRLLDSTRKIWQKSEKPPKEGASSGQLEVRRITPQPLPKSRPLSRFSQFKSLKTRIDEKDLKAFEEDEAPGGPPETVWRASKDAPGAGLPAGKGAGPLGPRPVSEVWRRRRTPPGQPDEFPGAEELKEAPKPRKGLLDCLHLRREPEEELWEPEGKVQADTGIEEHHGPLPGRLPWQRGMPKSGLTQLRGVFSTGSTRKIGSGWTSRHSSSKVYWFLEQNGESIFRRPLNENMVPHGTPEQVPIDQFMRFYVPEPEVYTDVVLPKLRELARRIDSGDVRRERGFLFAAEYEYNRALEIDVDSLRANFGIAMTYLEQGDTKRAKNIFKRIIALDVVYDEGHKHLLNELAISLRKCEMFEEAMEYYSKAASLAPDDENLFMNIARLYMEMAMFTQRNNPMNRALIERLKDGCLENLERSLALNPALPESRLFLQWMVENGLLTGERESWAAGLLMEGDLVY